MGCAGLGELGEKGDFYCIFCFPLLLSVQRQERNWKEFERQKSLKIERVGLLQLPGAGQPHCQCLELSCNPRKAQESWWLRAGWKRVAGTAPSQGSWLVGSCPAGAFQGSWGRRGNLDLAPSLLQEKHRHLLRNWLSIAPLQWKKRAGGGKHEKGCGELEGSGDSQE